MKINGRDDSRGAGFTEGDSEKRASGSECHAAPGAEPGQGKREDDLRGLFDDLRDGGRSHILLPLHESPKRR